MVHARRKRQETLFRGSTVSVNLDEVVARVWSIAEAVPGCTIVIEGRIFSGPAATIRVTILEQRPVVESRPTVTGELPRPPRVLLSGATQFWLRPFHARRDGV